MNRGFSFPGRVLLAVLCSFLLFASPAIAGERTARVLTIDSATWSADLVASEPQPDTTLETTNCIVGPVPSISLTPNGAAIVRDIARMQCTDNALAHITELRVKSGDADLSTQLTYRDQAGDFNTVSVPEITTTLPASPTPGALRFSRIESSADRSSFFALFAATPQFVTFTVYDGSGQEVGLEEVHILAGFTWLELETRVEIGSAEIRRGTTTFGCPGCQDGGALDAICFVGYRSGGGPRVEMPALVP